MWRVYCFISVFGGAALSLLMIMVMHLLFIFPSWVEFTIYFICFDGYAGPIHAGTFFLFCYYLVKGIGLYDSSFGFLGACPRYSGISDYQFGLFDPLGLLPSAFFPG